jgi:hypothetical protein
MTFTHTNYNSTNLVACTQQWDVQILSLLLDRRKGGVHHVPKVPGAIQQQTLHSLLLPFIKPFTYVFTRLFILVTFSPFFTIRVTLVSLRITLNLLLPFTYFFLSSHYSSQFFSLLSIFYPNDKVL